MQQVVVLVYLSRNDTDYLNNYSAGQGSSGEWGARTAGTQGNSLGVSIMFKRNRI